MFALGGPSNGTVDPPGAQFLVGVISGYEILVVALAVVALAAIVGAGVIGVITRLVRGDVGAAHEQPGRTRSPRGRRK